MRRWITLVVVAVSLMSCGDRSSATTCQNFPDFDLWSIGASGGEPKRLTDSPGLDAFADWSPEGTRIAFVSGREGNCDIFVMDPDGSNLLNLTQSEEDELYPSWSPDGSRIVFSKPTADGNQLFILDVGSGGTSQLTDSALMHNYPDWSPDGVSIVFAGGVDQPEPDAVHQIYVLPGVGGEETPITNGVSLLVGPKWSPDGSQIAFFDHEDPFHIWIMGADGADRTSVGGGGHLSWSPDGTSIVHDREVAPPKAEGSADVDLYVDEELLVDSAGIDTLPAWSPGGDVVVFASDRP
jgi:TolB protein